METTPQNATAPAYNCCGATDGRLLLVDSAMNIRVSNELVKCLRKLQTQQNLIDTRKHNCQKCRRKVCVDTQPALILANILSSLPPFLSTGTQFEDFFFKRMCFLLVF